MILYRTAQGLFVEHKGSYHPIDEPSFDNLVAHEDLQAYLIAVTKETSPTQPPESNTILAPIEHQEVWAAGVTYYNSRRARVAESKDAGGGDFYDRVYSAERPELFFKAVAHRVAGPNTPVKIRRDATWSVPEPELTLLINPRAKIIGYTIGNDMSSRDIEGANPLYLPQAKVYDRSCALGPGVLIQSAPMEKSTQIHLDILRSGHSHFAASVAISELKRDPLTLVEYLFRDQTFPYGCFLLTGTGLVPTDSFTLQSKDEIRISIDTIGTLVNEVA